MTSVTITYLVAFSATSMCIYQAPDVAIPEDWPFWKRQLVFQNNSV